jgi:hypothetical protein
MDIGDQDRSSKIERDNSFIKTTEFALHLLIANTKTRTQRFSDVLRLLGPSRAHKKAAVGKRLLSDR